MTQAQKRIFLIRYLLSEQSGYGDVNIPDDVEEQQKLLRSLMNIRMPEPVSVEFMEIQDAYLQQEAAQKGVVSVADIPTIQAQYNSRHRHAERLSIWQGDITRLQTDAIVNAANSQMLGCFVPCHGCIDNAIHSAAGIQLRAQCQQLMQAQGHEEKTGCAKITGAGNLPAGHVIHTVGPIVYGGLTESLEQDLANCYRSCLELAAAKGLKSIAFCCISTGEFHFPNERAAEIAVQTVSDFLKVDEVIKRVIFNVFKPRDLKIYERLLQ